MNSFNIKIFLILGIIYCAFEPLFLKAVEIHNNSKLNPKNLKSKSVYELRDILSEEKFDLSERLLKLVQKDLLKKVENNKFSVDIDSDKQYQIDDKFFAEGNVILKMKNGTIKTDKFIYDRKNKIIKAEGKVFFEKGNQFFEASYLEYDFIKEEGFIYDIYGLLDFKRIDKDLNLDKNFYQKDNCKSEELDFNNLETENSLLNSDNVRVKKNLGIDLFQINFSKIKSWRFKSKKINFSKNSWYSDLVFFTNDIYNNPQLVLKSKGLSGEIIDGRARLTSKSTSIKFDNKISIPIGKRTINNSDLVSKWDIGYDKKNKDGLFISRSLEEINKEGNLKIKLKPFFLFERTIDGKTNSFRAKNSSITSNEVINDADFLDYFAVNANINGKILDSSFTMNNFLKTLNPARYYDGLTSDFNLIRNLYSKSFKGNLIDNSCDVYFDKKNSTEKYNMDIGLYGAFEKEDIYTTLGLKIINQYKFNKEKIKKNYSLVFDLSNHNAKSLNNENNLVSFNRYGLSTFINHEYKIFSGSSDKQNYNQKNIYSSNIVNNGLYLSGNLSYGYNYYNNVKSQSILQISLGPKFVYGNLKNKFFDYTSISLIPEYSFKNGESPFKFDNFNEDSRIKFNINQQIYGPLIIGFSTNININSNSSHYGDFENIKYSLGLSRRAYSLSLNYDKNAEKVLFKINIFNFDYDKFIPKF